MSFKSDRELQVTHADLLRVGDDQGLLTLLSGLDEVYGTPKLPPSHGLPAALPLPHAARPAQFNASTRRNPIWRRWTTLLLACAVLVISVGAVIAAQNIVNLGKPVSVQSTNGYFPLSGFRYVPTDSRVHGEAELVFIGTQVDVQSGVERWPVVKALDQFGTFSGVKPDMSTFGGLTFPQVATFDLSSARYHSKYVIFDHVDLFGHNSTRLPFQHPSSSELALYDRYAREPKPLLDVGGHPVHDPDHVLATLHNRYLPTTRQFPLVSVGHYLQTISRLMVEGDFQQVVTLQPSDPTSPTKTVTLSFDTVRNALLRGQDPPLSRLVENVNAEANIITALICRADGLQPSKVCGRAVISSILKHVRA
jgi:hypothetical protein